MRIMGFGDRGADSGIERSGFAFQVFGFRNSAADPLERRRRENRANHPDSGFKFHVSGCG